MPEFKLQSTFQPTGDPARHPPASNREASRAGRKPKFALGVAGGQPELYE